MKEIDINIEGYNVNGICVGCLNYNRKMFYDTDAKDCFKLIANIDVPDGLQIQVCWECLAAIKNILMFREQILNSYDVLLAYSQKHTFLNAPEDFTIHASTRLSTNTLDHIDTTCWHVDIEVKDDIKEEESVLDIELDTVKEEPETEQLDDYDFDIDIEDNTQKEEISSDEDLQLSEVKKKKNKKHKKKKEAKKDKEEESKSSRKLKNLPESVVGLYKMSEEEMWVVREKDVNSEEFQKLKYKCTDCILAFNTEKLRDAHFNGKHKQKSSSAQQCDVCKAYFLTSDKISTHRALHLSAYKCSVCLHTTTLKRLMFKHHCAADVRNDEFKCANCEKVFSTKSKLSYHKNVCHQERPQCDCCGKVFANKMTLKYHLKILPQNKEKKPKEKLFIPCRGCNKVFHSKKSYRAHVLLRCEKKTRMDTPFLNYGKKNSKVTSNIPQTIEVIIDTSVSYKTDLNKQITNVLQKGQNHVLNKDKEPIKKHDYNVKRELARDITRPNRFPCVDNDISNYNTNIRNAIENDNLSVFNEFNNSCDKVKIENSDSDPINTLNKAKEDMDCTILNNANVFNNFDSKMIQPPTKKQSSSGNESCIVLNMNKEESHIQSKLKSYTETPEILNKNKPEIQNQSESSLNMYSDLTTEKRTNDIKPKKRKYIDKTRIIRTLFCQSNKEYVNQKGVVIQPREFVDVLCKDGCHEKITVKDRQEEFAKFWDLSFEGKCLYISSNVKVIPIKRKRNKESNKRKNTRLYYLRNVKVCAKIFVQTLKISTARIDRYLKKSCVGEFGDKRGKGRRQNV